MGAPWGAFYQITLTSCSFLWTCRKSAGSRRVRTSPRFRQSITPVDLYACGPYREDGVVDGAPGWCNTGSVAKRRWLIDPRPAARLGSGSQPTDVQAISPAWTPSPASDRWRHRRRCYATDARDPFPSHALRSLSPPADERRSRYKEEPIFSECVPRCDLCHRINRASVLICHCK